MTSDSTVVPLRQPEETEDPLTAILGSMQARGVLRRSGYVRRPRGGVGQRRSLWPDVTPPQGFVCSLFHGRILHQTYAPKKPNLIRALILERKF